MRVGAERQLPRLTVGSRRLSHAVRAADNPKLLKGSPILFVDNQINPGVIAVAFRTDRPLDRKSNGKSIEGRAGVKGHSDSLSTFVKDQRPSYIAYVSGVSFARGGEHLKVGHRYKVTISLGHQEVTRTVALQKNTKESAVQRLLGLDANSHEGPARCWALGVHPLLRRWRARARRPS